MDYYIRVRVRVLNALDLPLLSALDLPLLSALDLPLLNALDLPLLNASLIQSGFQEKEKHLATRIFDRGTMILVLAKILVARGFSFS
jgi:hypothetical protein